MNPSVALSDPAFFRFAWIVPTLFIVAGLILVIIQFGFSKDLGSIWLTYRSWWVMGLLGLIVVFAGSVAIIVSVSLLGIFGCRELIRTAGLSRMLVWVVSAAIVAMVLIAPALLKLREWYPTVTLVCFGALVIILLAGFAKERVDPDFRGLAIPALGFILLGIFFTQLALLVQFSRPYGLICFLIFATELSDVAAFIFGRLFGRHLLAPRISPRKTWEGALGAFAVSMLLPWLLRFALPGFSAMHLVLAGLIIGIGGQLGDLTVSAIKRALGAKDLGALIPGHGGILDRIDSLIYVAPLFIQLAARSDAMT